MKETETEIWACSLKILSFPFCLSSSLLPNVIVEWDSVAVLQSMETALAPGLAFGQTEAQRGQVIAVEVELEASPVAGRSDGLSTEDSLEPLCF